MNTLRLHALTSAHVDTLKRALRIAIRHDRQTLSIERARLTPASIEQAKAHIRAMEQLADGLSPSAPPALPEAADFDVCTGASDCPDCAVLADPGALQPCGHDCPVLPAAPVTDHAALYLEHLRLSNKGFDIGDRVQAEHHRDSAREHLHLYAIQNGGIPSDVAAARIRQAASDKI